MQHDQFTPSFVVDVTSTWERKLQSLAAYRTQIHQPGAPDVSAAGPATKVASREFALAIEGRARHFGLMISAEYAEPFWSRTPLAVEDPWSLLPRGQR